MVKQSNTQAINSTNSVNLNSIQANSHVYAEPGIADKMLQAGYVPQSAGAPIGQDTVQIKENKKVQNEEEVKKKIKKQKEIREQQRIQRQQQEQVLREQKSQEAKLRSLKDQEKNLKNQMRQQPSQQQGQQQVIQSNTDYSKYYSQACMILALVAGFVLYYLNKNGYFGKNTPAAPIRPGTVSGNQAAEMASSVGGNLNQMFKYLFSK